MAARTIVVFDCADTLLELQPARERIVQDALGRLGARCELSTIRTAYRVVDFALQQRSSRERTPAQKAAFFTRYNTLLAVALGLETKSRELDRVLQEDFETRRHWAAAEGAEEALKRIGARYPMYVLANWSASLGKVLASANLAGGMAGVFSSEELGSEKPFPSVFHAFAERAGVNLGDCYYLGNDYLADVVGSRGAGMEPLLLDRREYYPDGADCPVFRSWHDVAAHLAGK
jgi:putative hydrolase of the HAD superfamily